MDFNVLDLVLGGILLLSGLSAARNGLTKELIRIASLVLGVVVAMWLHDPVARELLPWIQNPRISSSVAFVLVLVGCLLVGALTAYLLSVVWNFTGLRWLDMLLGGVFGTLRGMLVSAILLLGLIAFQPVSGSVGLVADSAIAPWILGVARALVTAAPQSLHEAYVRGAASVRDARDSPPDEQTEPLDRADQEDAGTADSATACPREGSQQAHAPETEPQIGSSVQLA